MTILIIGHRGFVGSNLCRHFPNAAFAGRKEIDALAGHSFTDIYCAAPQAKKWWANQNPEEDRLEVETLIKACRRIACSGSFILFSTVDVYDPPVAVDERSQPPKNSHPYGYHRHMLEQSVLDFFGSKARIVRLPALVGPGLKKNIIYDLLNNNNVEQINPNSTFQWFNLDQLVSITERAKNLCDGQILNVASEPVATISIVDTWFAEVRERLNWQAAPIGYDVRTVHGSDGTPYLYSAEHALQFHLRPFIVSQKA